MNVPVAAMSEERARRILGDTIQPDNSLNRNDGGGCTKWAPGTGLALLDGFYSAERLEALAWWMNNGPGAQ